MLLVWILMTIYSTAAFDIKCPHLSQRRFRAMSMCEDESRYSCLFDTISEAYIETCNQTADYVAPVVILTDSLDIPRDDVSIKTIALSSTCEKYEISGSRLSSPCSTGSYQPFKFWSNVQSQCFYKKSLCNEDEQMIYNHTSPKEDSICICNYTNGYGFVTEPRHACHCIPSQEDCTCYRRLQCPQDMGLSNDEKCRFNSSYEIECRPVVVARSNNSSNINRITAELLAVGGPKYLLITISILITISVIDVCIIIVILVTNHCASYNQEKYTDLNRNQNTVLLLNDLDLLDKSLIEWISNTNGVITELRKLATDLNEHFRNINIAKVSGSAGAIAGGILTVVGVGLTPVTFGGSLGLCIAGGALVTAGSVTGVGSVVADAILSDNKRQEAEDILGKHASSTKDVKDKCIAIGSTLQKLGKIEECFSAWVIFWAKVVGLSEEDHEVKWISVMEIMTAELKLSAETLIVGFTASGGIGRAASGVGRHTGTILVPMNIFTLIDSAISIHKKTPNRVSENIACLANILEKQCPTIKDSAYMIQQIKSKL